MPGFTLPILSVNTNTPAGGPGWCRQNPLFTWTSLSDIDLTTRIKASGVCDSLIVNPPDLIFPGPGGQSTLTFDMDFNNIIVSGFGTLSIFGLPTGFNITVANLHTIRNSSGLTNFLRDGFTFASVNPDTGLARDDSLSANLKVLSICNAAYGFELNVPAGIIGASQGGIAQLVRVDGTYEILSGSFTTDPTVVQNGEITDITATSNLDGITEIQLIYDDGGLQSVTIPAVDFLIQTSILLRFRISLFFPFTGTVSVVGIGNGIQFSGSVTLGILNILIENGSGIYRIVPNKTNDTIYVDSVSGPTTTNVKIPNPFGKTGYIGG